MTKKEQESEEKLGFSLRDIALRCFIHHNPHTRQPGWENVTDFSLTAWTNIARALIVAGWRPPLGS